MKFLRLLEQSKNQLAGNPPFALRTFDSGAEWMKVQLLPDKTSPHPAINFSAYGFLKYSIALTAFVFSGLFLGWINVWLTPLAVIIFYFAEVHFLFLFPLLIDGVKAPMRTSIIQTYRIGIFKATLNVLPIGFYMVAGLLRFRDPFRNWYVGCLAIVLWYCNEVRDRV